MKINGIEDSLEIRFGIREILVLLFVALSVFLTVKKVPFAWTPLCLAGLLSIISVRVEKQ